MRTKFLGTALAMLFFCGSLAWLPARGQDRPQDGRTDEVKKDDGAGPVRSGRPRVRIRPYDRVITKEAKTSPGLFLVHRIEDKVYFEIPTAELGKEMLWVTQLEQTAVRLQLRRRAGGRPRGAVGAARRRYPAARREVSRSAPTSATRSRTP